MLMKEFQIRQIYYVPSWFFSKYFERKMKPVLPFPNLVISLFFPFFDRNFLQKISKIPSNFLLKISVQQTLIEENV